MALNCSPQFLRQQAECFGCGAGPKQLLAEILYVLCQVNGMNCSPQALIKQSAAFFQQMSETQMLASITFLLCNGGAGQQVFAGKGAPSASLVPANGAGYYTQIDSTPPGIIFEYYNGSWH